MISPLSRIAIALVIFVALEHLGFFVLESFLWQTQVGRQVFKMNEERARITAPLAANQGVYNAFLGAGLLWGLSIAASEGLGYVEFSRSIVTFFLGCVVVAGIVGALTVNRRIFFIQAVPALGALLAMGLALP